jgi:hypothetical protein
MRADSLFVEVSDAFERAARRRAVFVDAAAVVIVEELAAAVDIGEDRFDDMLTVALEAHAHSERSEPAGFVGGEQDGEIVTVLLAAVGVALAAGTLTGDGESDPSLRVHPAARITHMLRRWWPVLALVAGGLLLFFEIKKGDWAESWFWVAVAGLIIVLALMELVTRRKA